MRKKGYSSISRLPYLVRFFYNRCSAFEEQQENKERDNWLQFAWLQRTVIKIFRWTFLTCLALSTKQGNQLLDNKNELPCPQADKGVHLYQHIFTALSVGGWRSDGGTQKLKRA